MRRAHTPPSTTPPEPSGGHIDPIDLVPGDPPVPITVWRTPAGDDQSTIPTRLAQRLIAAYSAPGEVVVDLTDGHALSGPAVAGGRHHHRGWFTDASAVTIAAATPPSGTEALTPSVPAAARGGHQSGEADPPGLAAWYGDDLTDPHLPPHHGAPAAGGEGRVQGATSLVVACWPLHPQGGTNQTRLRWLLHAACRLLRPGGCMVLAVQGSTHAVAGPQDFGPLLHAARQAGLGYLQHIVAVRADVDGDQFTYYATDAELAALASRRPGPALAGGDVPAAVHLRVHADLLVLSRTHGGGVRG
jgi:hypothetical protein